MPSLSEEQITEAFDRFIVEERQDKIAQAAEAQGVVLSSPFKLEWLDEATNQAYILRGFRAPKKGIMAYSLSRQDRVLDHSELRFSEKTSRINTSGPIRRETRGLSAQERQAYLGGIVCRVLGNMIAEGYSEQFAD